MNLHEALDILKAGYCLWVGAGVPIQLAGNSANRPPQWQELIDILEKKAEISLSSELEHSERLTIVLTKIGRYKFAQMIREIILERLATAILENATDSYNKHPGEFPPQFVQIATLGHLACPIVNFNVETLSSIALAGIPDIDFSLKIFKIPDIDDDFSGAPIDGLEAPAHKRQMLHPHGAINAYGRCVLSDTEYATLDGTLALQLATHAAFQSNLVIVGMTLNDTYLRKQLSKFRRQINKILWFMTKNEHETLSKEIIKFVLLNNIRIITFDDWQVFWTEVNRKLPKPNNDALIKSYERLTSYSLNLLGSRAGVLVNLHSLAGRGDMDFCKQMEFYVKEADAIMSAQHRGESWSAALMPPEYNAKKSVLENYIQAITDELIAKQTKPHGGNDGQR